MRSSPEIDAAWKDHMRKRRIEGTAAGVGFIVLLLIMWWLDLRPPNAAFLGVSALIVLGFLEIKRRLKAMQIRLAEMHDEIDALRGNAPQNHMLLELTAD
jgi:type II secretory pathway component PulM